MSQPQEFGQGKGNNEQCFVFHIFCNSQTSLRYYEDIVVKYLPLPVSDPLESWTILEHS